MRAKLANLNHCAVPFLSCAAVNLSWYYYTYACKNYALALVWCAFNDSKSI